MKAECSIESPFPLGRPQSARVCIKIALHSFPFGNRVKRPDRRVFQFFQMQKFWQLFSPPPMIDYCNSMVNIRVTGEHFLTILGPRTRFEAHFYPFFHSDDIRSDPTVYTIRVFSRSTRTLISEVTDLKDKPEYLVFRWVG